MIDAIDISCDNVGTLRFAHPTLAGLTHPTRCALCPPHACSFLGESNVRNRSETLDDAKLTGWGEIFKIWSVVVPLIATTLAVTFDVGYFYGLDINYFTFFSLSEHIVFALQALPIVIGILVFAPILLALQYFIPARPKGGGKKKELIAAAFYFFLGAFGAAIGLSSGVFLAVVTFGSRWFPGALPSKIGITGLVAVSLLGTTFLMGIDMARSYRRILGDGRGQAAAV